MRTPNLKCIICSKPLYRRPKELKRIRWAACIKHRDKAKRMFPITEKQQRALNRGRIAGRKYPNRPQQSKTERNRRSKSLIKWCKKNSDKIKARGQKTRGANHYKWKGGITQLNQSIRRMTENRKWMDAVKARDKKCQHCESNKNLESHHIIPIQMIIEKDQIKNRENARNCAELWDIKNGITLCRKCHYKLHKRNYAEY